jgi:hypothetical protein
MVKKALIVGINYIGTSSALKGCINDAYNMQAFLTQRGFTDINMVLEKEATTSGITEALNRLVTGVVPGDVIVFHYSGHGSQLPSASEADGFEEIICPVDLNWIDKVITDKTLRSIFNKVPNGVNITLVLDCCHSGTMLNQDETLQTTKDIQVIAPTTRVRKVKGARYLKPPAKIIKALAKRELVEWQASRDVNATALLIAGCHANQTSADAFIDGVPQGAATAALLKAVKEKPQISYRILVTNMCEYMVTNRYTQVPQLDGSPALYDQAFLESFNVGIQQSPPVAEPTPAKAEPGTNTFAIIGIVAVVLLIIIFA